MPDISVEFKNLSVGYNSVSLHKPFSFSIKEGEFVSLIGANGSGKSTILKTLIKEIPPLSGDIFLWEAGTDSKKNLRDFTEKELSRIMSALLTVNVKPELLTCRDVVAGGRYPYTGHFGLLTKEDNLRIDEALSLVKAESFAHRDFTKVSDGQKQRILFARALCQNPKVLVLDEPNSYLDIRWRLEMFSILKNLCQKGVTVIASLHEIDLALRSSDRILCVGEGSVTELSREEAGCRAQIQSLYGLKNDFFEKEEHYAKLVKNFCIRGAVAPTLQTSGFPLPPRLGAAPLKPQKTASNSCDSRHSCIMIQGTMSNAGKSFVVAGLCRIFAQDGFSVAPFKSQNMALNSFVTNEGLEMGRAQVMQAEAAGIEASVYMNPILLKPTSDVGSQVIVNGEVLGNMGAKEYFAFKKSLIPHIKKAYEKLASEHEIIVIEGAGSPAEINLKQNDIVNMGMAKIADSPVLLVADIDRGGVFAQLLGTIELLEPNERSRIKGLIINKFRGDKSILDSGIKMIEEKTGIPVVGTLPYIKIQLDDEDSLSKNLHTLTKFQDKKDEIQLAIIRLPHISNFTDFIPLQNHPAVNTYYAEKPEDLGSPDCIILPGTKNTLADLKWLKDTGFADLIQKKAKRGTPTAGICGGFQMLGQKIHGNEEENKEKKSLCTPALGLLPLETEFSAQKTRTRVSGFISPAGQPENIFSSLKGLPVSGYEIHMGRTYFCKGEENTFMAQITDSVSGERKCDGAVKGNIFGTYIHGFFDEEILCQKFIEILAKRKGIKSQIFNARHNPSAEPHTFAEFKESQYNLLADTLRSHLDMAKIYKIMGCKP